MKYSKIGVIFTLIGLVVVSILYSKQFEKEENKDITFIEHVNWVSDKAEIILDKKTPHKATIKLKDIKKEEKEINVVLTVINNNAKITSTLKNLEISGDTKDSIIKEASFPDGAKKITLSPYELTTINVKIKIKKDIEELSFVVSFKVD